MDKVFVDTNIIIDWLANRTPFAHAAKSVFKLGEDGKIEILISTMSYISTEYILRKQLGKDKTKSTLAGMRTISTVCFSGGKEIDLSLISKFKDFEDAFQYYSAINNGANIILTRNQKDFKDSLIPVMTADQYLKSIL